MKLNINSTIKLNNGELMPRFGFGTWGVHSKQPMEWALKEGYLLLDTAKFYGNEKLVGEVVKNSEIPRKNIFVTTKLWPIGILNPKKEFEESYKKLGLDYIDLYLIHWPAPGWLRAWKELASIPKEQCKAIGVSNFSINQLEKLIKETNVVPAVNQVIYSPTNHDEELREYCINKGIAFEAYSSLKIGAKLSGKKLVSIAEKHKKTPAQVVLRWVLQKDAIAIPKSNHLERIKENKDLFDFELSKEEMNVIDNL